MGRLCGREGCASNTAAFECMQCHGVYYCTQKCEKTDELRHKSVCLPVVAASTLQVSSQATGNALANVFMNASPPKALMAAKSTAVLDKQLGELIMTKLVTNFKVLDRPKLLKKELPPIVALAKRLIQEGARPDVCTTKLPDGAKLTPLLMVLECHNLALDPLLEALLSPLPGFSPSTPAASPAPSPTKTKSSSSSTTAAGAGTAASSPPVVLDPPLRLDHYCEAEDGSYSSPLAEAIESLIPNHVRMLLSRGASVAGPCCYDAVNDADASKLMPAGQRPRIAFWPVWRCIHAACRSPTLMDAAMEILDMLIEAGADMDASDNSGLAGRKGAAVTPLLHVFEAMMRLGEQGSAAKQPALGSDKGSPTKARENSDASKNLDMALIRQFERITARLIEAGADVNARDVELNRVLDWASQLPTLTVFKLLIAKGADPRPTVYKSAIGEDKAGVHYLQRAVQEDRVDVLEAAVEAGVVVGKVRLLGPWQPPLLGAAISFGSSNCAKFLVQNLEKCGVDVNDTYLESCRNPECKLRHIATALDGAADGREANHDLEAMLRAAGAKTYDELWEAGLVVDDRNADEDEGSSADGGDAEAELAEATSRLVGSLAACRVRISDLGLGVFSDALAGDMPSMRGWRQ